METRNTKLTIAQFKQKRAKSDKRFDKLLEALIAAGYKINVRECKDEFGLDTSQLPEARTYRFAFFRSKGLHGGFCTFNNNSSYCYIDDRICIDHIKCFDKWSKAPVSLPLPKNVQELNFLLEEMAFLASLKGKMFSNNFDYKIVYEYPADFKHWWQELPITAGDIIFDDIRQTNDKTAKRKRQCFCCGERIAIGEKYVNHQFRYDYRILTVSFHKLCYKNCQKPTEGASAWAELL